METSKEPQRTNVKALFWLMVNSKGTVVKTTKQRPGVGFDEIAIYISLVLPEALFHKPTLSASIVIPQTAAMPTEITAETVADAKAAIEQATGMQVRISLERPEDDQ